MLVGAFLECDNPHRRTTLLLILLLGPLFLFADGKHARVVEVTTDRYRRIVGRVYMGKIDVGRRRRGIDPADGRIRR